MTRNNFTYIFRHLFRTCSLLFLVLAMAACSSDDTDSPDGPQKPGPSAKFTLTPQTVTAEAVSEPIEITVTTGADVEWSVDKPFKKWITATPSTTKGSGTITLDFEDNDGKDPRTIDLIVRCAGIEDPFYINIEQKDGPNAAPTAPTCKLPDADATAVSPFPVFSWNGSFDENNDKIKYTVSYSTDQTTWTTSDKIDGTTFTVKTRLEASTKYFWYVTAIDARGLETKGDTRSFTTGDVQVYADGEWVYYDEASKSGKVPLVFTGDGFIESDYIKGTGDFDTKVDLGIEHFFSREPYKAHRSKFKIIKLAAYSKEQGITIHDIGTDPGSSYTGDPYRVDVNTRFKVQYKGNGFNRTLMTFGEYSWDSDLNVVFDFVQQHVPDCSAGNDVFNNTTVIVIANHWLYGGTCWWPSTSATTARTLSIVPACEKGHPIPWCGGWGVPFSYDGTMRHEAGGHGFGRLADEYKGSNSPADDNYRQNFRAEVARGFNGNIDITNDKTKVRWKDFFDAAGAPIAKYPKVGTFVCLKFSTGVWMSETANYDDRNSGSCMNNMENEFSAASREFIVQKIYKAAGEEYIFQNFLSNDVIPSNAQSVRSSKDIPMMRNMPHTSPHLQ